MEFVRSIYNSKEIYPYSFKYFKFSITEREIQKWWEFELRCLELVRHHRQFREVSHEVDIKSANQPALSLFFSVCTKLTTTTRFKNGFFFKTEFQSL